MPEDIKLPPAPKGRRGAAPGERRGGRQKGTKNKRTRDLAMQAIINASDGISPVEVMLANMRFWTSQTIELTDQIKKLIVNADSEESRKEAFTMLRQMLAARENAESCAVDAAPYCHPRLASITQKVEPLDLDDLPEPVNAIEAAEQYKRLVGNG